MRYALKHKLIHVGEEDTHADEILGFGTAALGFLFQLRYGFTVPFPLNIALLPISVTESIITWMVATGGAPQVTAAAAPAPPAAATTAVAKWGR